MSNIDDTGLNLDQLFLPAWAQQSADVNKYADFAGYTEDEKDSGTRKGRRGDRNERRGPRSSRPRTGEDREQRADRPRRERADRGASKNAENSNDENKEVRSGRPNRNGGRRDRNDRSNGPRRERKPLPPLPKLDAQLVPEAIVVETLAQQIRQSGRAYPLFDIARIILKKPERLEVSFSTIKENGQVAQEIFFCSLDRTVWLSENDAMEHVLKDHFANFYETQKIPVEGPKGTYTFVAQCGMSGEVLGPPNLHDYQSKICKIHAEKFPNVPFDVYKARIRIVKDPEIIEKWKEQMSFTSHYNCLQVPEPLVLQDMASVREHFRQTHLASVVQKVDTITLSQADLKKQPNAVFSVLYRRLLEEQRRFPLKLVTVLSLKFASHALQFFKVDKTVTHVCISRPHYLDLENTSVSENVRKIMAYVVEHKDCKRSDIYGALVPGYTEAMGEQPKAEPQAEAAEPTAETKPAEQSDARALPQEVASLLANLNADLHWLIQCGHVIEFCNGNIEAAPKKATPPPAKVKKKAGTKADAKKPVEAKAESPVQQEPASVAPETQETSKAEEAIATPEATTPVEAKE